MVKPIRKNLSKPTDQEPFVALDKKIKELERLEKKAELEVIRLKESRQLAKSQRNSLTPICSLPPELLATIFSFTENLAAHRFRILRVCRHWRIVALEHPSLWSKPDFTGSPQLAAEMIKLSKRAPLTVRWQQNKEIDFQAFTNMLRGHIPRIAELGLEMMSWGTEDLLQTVSKWLKRASALRMLSIKVYSSHITTWNGTVLPTQRACIKLPASFLRGPTTPLLSSLSLNGCYIPWSSAVFRDLTFLQIRLGPASSSLPTMEQLLVILTRCPKLECLDLENCLPWTLTPTLPDIVPLRNLHTLRLSSTPSWCIGLLDSISFDESSATIVLKWESSDDIGMLDQLLPLFSRMFPRGERPVRSLSLKLGDPSANFALDTFTLDASTSIHNGLSADSAAVDLTEAGELHLYAKRTPGRQVFATLPRVFDALDITDLVEFSLSSYSSWFYDCPNFIKSFEYLSHLQVIHLHGLYAYQFVPCFCQLPDTWCGYPSTVAGDSNGAVTFPALRMLHIQKVDLHHYRTSGLYHCYLRNGFLQVIQDTLMRRWELGIELHSLRISDCTYLWRHELRKIEELVVDVVVSECDLLDSKEKPLIIQPFENTPRHYCAMDYQGQHKNATQQKFDKYWSEIEGTPAAERYEQRARAWAQALVNAAASGTANVNTQNQKPSTQNQNSGANPNPNPRTRKGGKRRKRR